MEKKRSGNDRFAYYAIAAINLCVALAFVAVLFPAPTPAQAEPVALVAPVRLKGGALTENINLGIPVRIVVPSVTIDLPVRTGSYDAATQTWTLDKQSAFYASNTVPVNDNNGSTILYAHAQWGLFAKIPDISTGATAQVYTDSGKVFSYTFASTRQVKADDTSIFVSTGPPMLTLLTCSGPFDTYRTLVSFTLSGVAPL